MFKIVKNSAKFGKTLAELLAIVNKHLNILTYLTKMSKIDENLWTNYKIRQKSAKICHKFPKIHKNIRKIGTWYTGIPPHRYTHLYTGIPQYVSYTIMSENGNSNLCILVLRGYQTQVKNVLGVAKLNESCYFGLSKKKYL